MKSSPNSNPGDSASYPERHMTQISTDRTERIRGMLMGTFIGDAHAMPAHWYYNRDALRQDYGWITEFMSPKRHHPDSILWRSEYSPLNKRGDILHDQAQYWGQKGIHYHQHLDVGENTLNLQLAWQLIETIQEAKSYDTCRYLERYRDFMLNPESHRDTYAEECHRQFFTHYARGRSLKSCGGPDNHIGGLASLPVFPALLEGETESVRLVAREHLHLTHHHAVVERAADSLIRILGDVLRGAELREAIVKHGNDFFSLRRAERWVRKPDAEVIDHHFSSACYIDKAFPASLYLAWTHAGRLRDGIIANTNIGGDNCHRGAVIGALLGADCGLKGIPVDWRRSLLMNRSLEQLAVFV